MRGCQNDVCVYYTESHNESYDNNCKKHRLGFESMCTSYLSEAKMKTLDNEVLMCEIKAIDKRLKMLEDKQNYDLK